MVRPTEVWDSFSVAERDVLRVALKKRAVDRTAQEQQVVQRYWQAQKRRSRSLLPKADNHTVNPAYREWLRKQGLPEVFDQKTFAQFKREEFM